LRQKCHIFPEFLRRFVWNGYSLILADKASFLHIVAARYYGLRREAAALPERFLPELGRSSERPFFCPVFLCPEFVARSLVYAVAVKQRRETIVRPRKDVLTKPRFPLKFSVTRSSRAGNKSVARST
jgi:hypothetical protein